jgi:pyruvate dehydrogenase E1 component alpha subunit
VRKLLEREELADAAFFAEVDAQAKVEAVELRERVLALPDPHPSEMFKHVYPHGSPEVDEQAATFAAYHASFEGAQH